MMPVTILCCALGLGNPGLPDGPVEAVRTRHFEIVCGDRSFAGTVGKEAEAHFEEISAALAHVDFRRPRFKRLRVSIFENRREYVENVPTDARLGDSAVISPTEIVTTRAAARPSLRHEITHLVVHAYFPSAPPWIQEGFATGAYERARAKTYERARVRLERDEILPTQDFIEIPSLGESPVSSELYYLQSRMLVEFLVFAQRGSLRRFHRFYKKAHAATEKRLARYAKEQKTRVVVRKSDWMGRQLRRVLADGYGYRDLEHLDADFRRYIAHRAREAKLQERRAPRKLEAPFEFERRLESEHFVVFSFASEPLSRRILEIAEQVHSAFAAEFWDTGLMMPGRLPIYFFDTRAEYAAYLESRGVKTKRGAALFPHFDGAACILRSGRSKDYMIQNAAHEVTHGLAIGLARAHGAGRWVNEGIAYYVGQSVNSRTTNVELGELHETRQSKTGSYLKLRLGRNRLVPLAELLGVRHGPVDAVMDSAASWGLFHFLQHAGAEKYREAFHRYLARIATRGEATLADFEKEIGPVRDVEMEFHRYLRRLEPDSTRR